MNNSKTHTFSVKIRQYKLEFFQHSLNLTAGVRLLKIQLVTAIIKILKKKKKNENL